MAMVERAAAYGVRSKVWRDLARLAAEGFAIGLFASLLLALAVFVVSTPARAAENPSQGTLLLAQGPGEAPIAAPLVFTDVHVDAGGLIARVQVTQHFHNPTGEWREGIYVFPLPEGAAVDHLRMRVGDRLIEGQIKERQEARRAYQQAQREGRKASLIEQERPNLFTNSVAHIGPDEDVIVAIEYQETLHYDQGTFRLRFPLAVTPRYVPGTQLVSGDAGTGWAANTDQVPDAVRVTPPVLHPAQGAINPVAIAVDLNPGFALAELTSRSHRIEASETPDHRYRIALASGIVPANRDFELAWTPDLGSAPGAALFTEERDGKTYALLMMLPPTLTEPALPRSPREVVFIIDTSGSMAGVSLAQAKAALSLALDRLHPGDRFNVIEFNSITRTLFGAPLPVDPATISSAHAFVSALKARGGTEMKPALETALNGERAPGFVRQVIFLTDGAVGNEDELLALIQARLGDRRLFTVGIGPGPNTFFLTKAAQLGRGTFTFIGDVREVGDKMSVLFRKLESPVLTSIAVAWPGRADAWPQSLPDLYAGEPLVVSAALDSPRSGAGAAVSLSGSHGGKPWSATLPFAAGAAEPGIGVHWARRKIEALADLGRNGGNQEEVRGAIIDVALKHHLVSTYTSLVAVDVTPTAPTGVESIRSAMPTNLPDGLSYAAIFGALPQTATPATLQLLIGMLALALAALSWRLRQAARLTSQRRPIGEDPSAGSAPGHV